MPSIVPGFEYDIFVSYRHNDNRSGWVTDFVNALQEELGATVKEPLTIYFDKNPHDGLLETYSVDKSLQTKLKCLIFVPILSQTYCDAKSFAWQHEFCAFNTLAKENQSGRDVRLVNGNVMSRILPIRIHDLEAEDKATIEDEIGGALRAIDFIYKEPGVNRPLKPTDRRSDNRSNTDYQNQVNKVAHAVKEMMMAVKKPNLVPAPALTNWVNPERQEKSIVVLPFVNMSNDAQQEYFSDGLTDELITELSRVKDLLVISRSSAMTFKGSNKKIKEIAQDVNVRYVLEGSVRQAGDNLRITAQLIDSNSDAHLWAEKYNGTLEQIFEIQERVALSIVDALKLRLSPEERNEIESHSIPNVHAYECYLKGKQEMYRGTKENMEQTFNLIQNGLDLIGPNELLYATLGYANYFYFRFVNKLDESYLKKADDCAKKVFELNPNSAHGHVINGWLHTTRGNLQEAVRSMKRALAVNPVNQEALLGISASMIWAGRCSETAPYAKKLVEIDPLTSFNHIVNGGYLIFDGATGWLPHFERAYAIDPQSPVTQWQLASAYMWCERNEDAFLIIDKLAQSSPGWPVTKQLLFLKYALLGNREEALKYGVEELKVEAKNDPHFAFHLAECYAVVDSKTEALDYLEMAIAGFYPHRFLSINPLFRNIKGEERFDVLLERARKKSEAFEV